MKLIIGIGNPGLKYENTRHNVGFMALDMIAEKYNTNYNENKFNSLYTIIRVNNERVILMKPQTYVNLSGSAVISIMNYYNISKDDILVIYDDIALPTAKLRVRYKGSGGGHNGIEDIIRYLKSNEFKRIRIGIGNNPNIERANYVLGRFTKSESELLAKSLYRLTDIPTDFIKLPFSDFMNKYNQEP